MMKYLLALILVAVPSVAHAQVTTTSKLIWTAPDNAAALADALSLEYRFRDNNGAFLVVPNVVCTSLAADGCTASLTPAMVASLNIIGVHNITLSAFSAAAGLESVQSVPFVLKSAPAVPMGLKLIP